MAEAERMQRVEDDDPLRCQGITKLGQCNIRAIEGSRFCPMHAGFGNKNAQRENVRNFRLSMWQSRMEEFADNDKVKSLREEIGILRILLEQTINKCNSETDLLLQTNRISDLVLKIEKVVLSCHRLEERTGLLIDKNAILQLAGVMIEIISKHVIDEDTLKVVGEEIIDAIAETQGLTKE